MVQHNTTPTHKLQEQPAEGDRETIERELKRQDAKQHSDGSLDIRPEDVQSEITDEALKGGKGGEREDPTPLRSIRAVVREGRDSVLGASDIDESEDNFDPATREQP